MGCLTIFVSINFKKFKIISFLNRYGTEKKFEPIDRIIVLFTQKHPRSGI
jgi:hypothetical protein